MSHQNATQAFTLVIWPDTHIKQMRLSSSNTHNAVAKNRLFSFYQPTLITGLQTIPENTFRPRVRVTQALISNHLRDIPKRHGQDPEIQINGTQLDPLKRCFRGLKNCQSTLRLIGSRK